MNEPMNKILVLGNGFDLAHYLPTKYDHFMTAMQAIVKSQNKEINFDELFADYLKNNDEFFLRAKELYKTDEFKLSESLVNNFKENLENNSWFQYFSKYLENTSNGIETWIDFENEIEKALVDVIKILNKQDNNDVVINNYTIHSNDYRLFAKNINMTGYTAILESFKIMSFYSKNNSYYASSHIDILNRYGNQYTSYNFNRIFKTMSKQLNDFKEIFSLYILEVIEKLQPKKPFIIPKGLDISLSAVFTFNYSDSFQRFYRPSPGAISKVQHLHGNAKVGNIVLGIDDLNDELKPYKIYDFVKTHQKIISNTDYNFLGDVALHINNKPFGIDSRNRDKYPPYEIIIWGHSLDISDKEYIKDIFNINTNLNSPEVYLIIWYYGAPHNSLANLIHIMGKDIIQNWVKKGWLKFEKMPDIYKENMEQLK